LLGTTIEGNTLMLKIFGNFRCDFSLKFLLLSYET